MKKVTLLCVEVIITQITSGPQTICRLYRIRRKS